MAITIPTIQELQQRITNDLALSINSGQLDTSKHIDPTIRNSFAKGFVDAMSAGFDENNDLLKQILIQIFPRTTTDIYLERWADFFGIIRKSAVKATGNVVFSGINGTLIPAATSIQTSNNISYITNSNSTITSQSIIISSITRVGSTVTVTTANNHNLASGILVSITGANEADYNVTNTAITVIGLTTFEYTISGTPTSPATGTILCNHTTAFVAVTASDFGVSGNLSSGATLSLVSPIANVDDSLFVSYDGLVGGLDIESDNDLRTRLLERTANLTAPFTNSGLSVFIKEKVAGVTRIWIKDATPSAGYTTIYFVRDNDINIIPTSQQILTVKNTIIDSINGIKPANMSDSAVVVSAPNPLSVDFTFSALSPNTNDMKNAITSSLTDYFKSTSVAVGKSISINKINNVIFSTLDSSGNQPTFTLSTPSTAINPIFSELPILGTITYP